MNKRELIARVQRHMGAGATREAATAAVNAVLAAIVRQAAQGRAAIPHFGAFEYRLHRERSAFGLEAALAGAPKATRRLAFTPARRLKERATGLCHALRAGNERQGK